MPKSFQAGDVVLREVTLRNGAGGRVSLLPQVTGIDIFEDMAKPTVFAQLYVFDSIGLLSNFPIIGEEEVTISFETPGIATPATYVLRVFQVTNVQQSDNRMAVGYTLSCVSLEHFYNSELVRSAYEGQLSDYVVHVVRELLNSKKKIRIEPTRGVRNIVSPSWKPLEAIDFAREAAVSQKYVSSSYVFFETADGFTFASVEYLCDIGSLGSRVFKFPYITAASDTGSTYRDVIEHEVLTRNDTIEVASDGVLRAETIKFDLLTKEVSSTSYNILSDYKDFVGTDKKQKFPQSASFAKQFGSPQRFFMIKDTSRPDDYESETLAPMRAYVSLLNNNVTRLLVHGDSGLRAGDLIELQVPEISGDTSRKHMDPIHSGTYIVLRLRHVITNGPKPMHELALDVGRVGVRR